MTNQGQVASIAVVTGGAKGIGAAVVERLRTGGATVASLDMAVPAAVREGVIDIIVDVTDLASVAAGFDEVRARVGRPTVVVKNAGIQRIGSVAEQPLEDWQAVLDTNLTGVFTCTAEALRVMKGVDGPTSIVNIASVAAIIGLKGRAAYSAAKSGVVALTKVAALEGAGHGTRVNAVAPGSTRTDLVIDTIASGLLVESDLVAGIPLGRIARPEEIASAVAFLAGPDSSYITGHVLVVDGGWSIDGSGAAVTDAADRE
jgi:NAD(P)-dependent dehydrogenase (short-subunit alcohol dehydrogenase family)